MIMNKKVKSIVFSTVFFIALMVDEALGMFPPAVDLPGDEASVKFSPAVDLSGESVMRCMAACRMARGQGDKRLFKYWKGSRWLGENPVENNEDPIVKKLKLQGEEAKLFLGRAHCNSVAVCKGRDIVIAFKGPPLGTTGIWSERDDETVHIDPTEEFGPSRGGWESLGKTHKVSLELWKLFSESIKDIVNDCVDQYNNNHQTSLEAKDFHVTMTGYDFGGRMAQCGAFGILEELFPDNTSNNVAVVTFGAPACYDATGASFWDLTVGVHNHRRFVLGRDTFFSCFSQGLSFTGAREELFQEKKVFWLMPQGL